MSPQEPRLVLASGSPRRKKLLQEFGYDFQVVVPDDHAETGMCSDCPPLELVARLAESKAENVAEKLERGLVLAADTVAECQGRILGKPRDEDHARQMLELMSGKIHRVLTGVCLIDLDHSNRRAVDVVVTTLKMDELSDSLIQEYLDSDQWIGKAGAFGFQDGLDWVHVTEGSESNVVGLPMERLAVMLDEMNA